MMRSYGLFVSAALATSITLSATPSHAGDDNSIGTTPAQMVEASTWATPPSEAPAHHALLVAVDPRTDWAVLHAGVRPHLGTFGGIATFALAHERTERFYGGFSLSALRNDAGTHVGIAQIAFGRNLADTFVGAAQISLTENRARDFYGL